MSRTLTHRIRPSNFEKVTLALLLLAPFLLQWLEVDRALAHALFFDDGHQWLGSGAGSWWARGLIHGAGRIFAYCVAFAALGAWALSYKLPALAPWRREALFVFVGMVLVTGIVGLLKQFTNVDCPWDLSEFGGSRPYIPFLAHRPDYLPRGRCFPGAHSSSGFALMSVYFALRGRRPRLARVSLLIAVIIGLIFAFGQQARGAHFLSHDLASAALAWGILLVLQALMLAPRAAPASAGAEPVVNPAEAAPPA